MGKRKDSHASCSSRSQKPRRSPYCCQVRTHQSHTSKALPPIPLSPTSLISNSAISRITPTLPPLPCRPCPWPLFLTRYVALQNTLDSFIAQFRSSLLPEALLRTEWLKVSRAVDGVLGFVDVVCTGCGMLVSEQMDDWALVLALGMPVCWEERRCNNGREHELEGKWKYVGKKLGAENHHRNRNHEHMDDEEEAKDTFTPLVTPISTRNNSSRTDLTSFASKRTRPSISTTISISTSTSSTHSSPYTPQSTTSTSTSASSTTYPSPYTPNSSPPSKDTDLTFLLTLKSKLAALFREYETDISRPQRHKTGCDVLGGPPMGTRQRHQKATAGAWETPYFDPNNPPWEWSTRDLYR